ncbi:MAG: amino acid ABC transporter substrate-binding protein [Gammaproteobacteria bacterium]|nr:amino acid ABC transporter substrate-binding protein [Gammaproteobacteria bacterium]
MIRKLLLTLFTLALAAALGAHAADPIRIGTTQSLSGGLKEFGTNQLRGLQMWAGDVNGRGELLGRPVEIVYYDDGSDPARSAELYRKLIEQDKVDLLVGPYSSNITMAASQVAEEHDFPMLTLGASADKIWAQGYQNIVGLDVPSTRYMDIAVETAAAEGARTLALVYGDNDFTRDVVPGVRSKARELGLEVVLDAPARSMADIPEEVRRLAAANADVIMVIAYLDGAVELVRALKNAQVKPDMLVFGVAASLAEFGQELQGDAEGITGVTQWLRGVRLPGAQDFAYRYRKLYGNNPGAYAVLGYSGGQVMEAAVRLAGTTDHTAVREQLHTMTFSSLLGIYKVDADGRQVGKNNYLLQWQGNDRRLVKPDRLAESKLIYPMP